MARNSQGNGKLLSEQEFRESHQVPHPGARGNKNGAGPHNISIPSMEKIREGGRKGGEAHKGMTMQRSGNTSGSSRSSTRSNSSAPTQQSRASSSMNRSRASSMNEDSNRGQQANNGLVKQATDRIRDAANKIDSLLGFDTNK